MAKRKPSTNAASEVRERNREDGARLAAAPRELVGRAEQVPEPAADSPRLKTSPRGYLVIAGTGAVLTPEMVKEASEDPPLSRLTEEIVEMAQAQHRVGVMDDATCRQITRRHMEPQEPAPKKVPRKKRPNRAIEAILEMAEDQHRSGLMDDAAYKQIILRHSGPQDPGAAKPSSGGVKGVRIRKKL
jgi:hypothetical protein